MDKEKKFENRTFSFLFFFLLLLLFESTREGNQATKEKKIFCEQRQVLCPLFLHRSAHMKPL